MRGLWHSVALEKNPAAARPWRDSLLVDEAARQPPGSSTRVSGPTCWSWETTTVTRPEILTSDGQVNCIFFRGC